MGNAPVDNKRCDPGGPKDTIDESTYISQLEDNDIRGFEITANDLEEAINGVRGSSSDRTFFSGSTRKGSSALIKLDQTSSDIYSLAVECEVGQQVLEEIVSVSFTTPSLVCLV